MKIKTFFLVGIGATLLFAAGGDSLTDPAVERNDPGSGTGTLDIRADVDAFDEAGGLFTEFSVQVRDGIDSGPAICRDGAALLGSYHSEAPERDRAFPGG